MTKRDARRVAFRYLETHPLTFKEVSPYGSGKWHLNWSGMNPDVRILEDALCDLFLGEFSFKLDGYWALGSNFYNNHVTIDRVHHSYPCQISDVHKLKRNSYARRCELGYP